MTSKQKKASNDLKMRHLRVRLAMAGGLVTAGVAVLAIGAQLGVVHVNAGDMKIALGRGESGLTMNIAARTCPPHCSFDIGWRPLAHW